MENERRDDPAKVLNKLLEIETDMERKNADSCLADVSRIAKNNETIEEEICAAKRLTEIAEAKKLLEEEREEALRVVDLKFEEVNKMIGEKFLPENEDSDESLQDFEGVNEEREMPFTKSEVIDEIKRKELESSKEVEEEPENFEAVDNAKAIYDAPIVHPDSESDESIYEELMRKPPEKFIKGKVYDFDEKKHGTRL